MQKKRYRWLIKITLWTAAVMLTGILYGCGKSEKAEQSSENNAVSEEKVFNYGTTAYGVEMGNTGLNPHEDYSGWSAVRYGVAETLEVQV